MNVSASHCIISTMYLQCATHAFCKVSSNWTKYNWDFLLVLSFVVRTVECSTHIRVKDQTYYQHLTFVHVDQNHSSAAVNLTDVSESVCVCI